MILYRPVGKQEYLLIEKSEFQYFPPRLPEQPIFYPVLNIEYARHITSKWNKDAAAGSESYVLSFEIEEFNRHIVGKIRVLEKY